MHKRQPALLRSESRNEYDELRDRILSTLKCQNPVEELFAQDVIAETWNIIRLRNAQALIVKSRVRSKSRLSDRAKERALKESLEEDLKEEIEASIKDGATREEALEDLVEPIYNAIKDENKVDQEIEDAVALESSIENQIRIDQLVDAAYKRRNDALQQLEWCRKELAGILKGASDAAIEAATNDHEQPEKEGAASTLTPLVPNED